MCESSTPFWSKRRTDAHDEFALFLGVVDEVCARHAMVACLGHHLRGAVERAAEAGADREQAAHLRFVLDSSVVSRTIRSE